jgi:hypothetical protein
MTLQSVAICYKRRDALGSCSSLSEGDFFNAVMIHLNRSLAREGHGRLGEGTAVQTRLRSKCDGGSGQNGACNNTVGAKGGGSTESPVDVLCFGSVRQDKTGVRSGKQGGGSLEEKDGVRFA